MADEDQHLEAASMRPRVFPAEDRKNPHGNDASHGASMRPRVFPAEDGPIQVEHRPRDGRFNEAAGIPRGGHWIWNGDTPTRGSLQ